MSKKRECVPLDLWEQKNMQIDERCKREAESIGTIKKRLEKIESKIDATLVFVIGTLLSILIAVGFKII